MSEKSPQDMEEEFFMFCLNVNNKVDKYSKAIISKYKIKEVEAILPLLNWSKLQNYNSF